MALRIMLALLLSPAAAAFGETMTLALTGLLTGDLGNEAASFVVVVFVFGLVTTAPFAALFAAGSQLALHFAYRRRGFQGVWVHVGASAMMGAATFPAWILVTRGLGEPPGFLLPTGLGFIGGFSVGLLWYALVFRTISRQVANG